MECKRCGNKDPSYFYKGSKGYYCRKCIRFARALLEEDIESLNYEIDKNVYDYEFAYELTFDQAKASKRCLELIQEGDVLLHCVCGAGKTEISVESISYYLSKGLKVCYAIARKEVVIELAERFKKIFPKANVVGVYGGHHDQLTGDLIVCTSHQLYRYYKSFDLLILDEVDAFPLKGNETLMNISLRSCRGNIIFSTATIDDSLKNILNNRNYKTVELFVRPSYKPLTIPAIYYLPKFISFILLGTILHSMANQCIIFVSNKKLTKLLYKFYSHLFSCTYVYADLDDRNKNIKDFKDKKYKFIFATTVLERGITIKDVNVIILSFDSTFDEANYIQMLGRVGRSILNPYGDAYIVTNHYDRDIKNTIKYLRLANSYL